MNKISQELVKIRTESKFRTSKSYFNYLKSCGLECNYQYYVKIESGISFPSSQLINQISKIVERHYAERLIKAYCSDQFVAFEYLFEETVNEKISSSHISLSSNLDDQKVNQGQKELTIKQVSILSEKKEHYFLFLILTLSRYPITLKELKTYPKLKRSVETLIESSIALAIEDTLRATSSEYIFPKATNEGLEGIYRLFDQWDIEFSTQFEFKKYINKMMIRRISPRYFGVIQKQIESLTDFVRCSDESDQKYNNEVLHMHISLSKGKLPG